MKKVIEIIKKGKFKHLSELKHVLLDYNKNIEIEENSCITFIELNNSKLLIFFSLLDNAWRVM